MQAKLPLIMIQIDYSFEYLESKLSIVYILHQLVRRLVCSRIKGSFTSANMARLPSLWDRRCSDLAGGRAVSVLGMFVRILECWGPRCTPHCILVAIWFQSSCVLACGLASEKIGLRARSQSYSFSPTNSAADRHADHCLQTKPAVLDQSLYRS